MKNDIAERIRLFRLSKNLSQQNMADELSITVAAYSNIERGKAEITVSRLFKIASILDLDVTELLSGKQLIKDTSSTYGFATKSDIEELQRLLKKHNNELDQIKKVLSEITRSKSSAKPRKKK